MLGWRMTCLAVFGLACAATARPQTADEIVTRHIAARGGLEKLRAVKSIRMAGRVIAGPGREALVRREIKLPGRIRTEFNFQGMTGVYACDGKRGWQVSPFDGQLSPEPMTPEQTRQALGQADIGGPLVDWRAKGHRVRLVGRQKVGDRETHELELFLDDGSTRRDYIDAESYLLLKTESERSLGSRRRWVETTFDDYREVGGLLFAHKIHTAGKGGANRLSVTVEKVELNPSLSDDRFEVPPGIFPGPPD